MWKQNCERSVVRCSNVHGVRSQKSPKMQWQAPRHSVPGSAVGAKACSKPRHEPLEMTESAANGEDKPCARHCKTEVVFACTTRGVVASNLFGERLLLLLQLGQPAPWVRIPGARRARTMATVAMMLSSSVRFHAHRERPPPGRPQTALSRRGDRPSDMMWKERRRTVHGPQTFHCGKLSQCMHTQRDLPMKGRAQMPTRAVPQPRDAVLLMSQQTPCHPWSR
mmetsp:Transcript_37312/g.95478  ORF Transcript_37312/g.95478 Transcript_37312/m.95478 type:complete len:223 (+) Transcript_37312:89-757(+)